MPQRNRRRVKLALEFAILIAISAVAIGAPYAQTNDPRLSWETRRSVYAAENDFGLRLLRTLTDGKGGNVIISPFSVSMVLAMTYNGAAGTTKTAMAKTLGLAELSDEEINAANRSLLDPKSSESLNRFEQDVEIANALWVQAGYAINPAFIKLNRDFYNASVQSLDFRRAPEKAVDAINDWTNKKTNGKIPSVIEEADPLTRLVLTDAAYFKGRWMHRFDKAKTKPRTFHLADDGSVKIPMMDQAGMFKYTETESFQEVILPYLDERFELFVFLPRDTHGLPSLLRKIEGERLESNIDGREGEIILPKFQTSFGAKLEKALTTMGMGPAFNENALDFSLIHSPSELFIRSVEHRAYISVDEEGTEAAGATAAPMYRSAMGVDFSGPFKMIVDHPFFFAIAEVNSKAILFAGVVTNPAK